MKVEDGVDFLGKTQWFGADLLDGKLVEAGVCRLVGGIIKLVG